MNPIGEGAYFQSPLYRWTV